VSIATSSGAMIAPAVAVAFEFKSVSTAQMRINSRVENDLEDAHDLPQRQLRERSGFLRLPPKVSPSLALRRRLAVRLVLLRVPGGSVPRPPLPAAAFPARDVDADLVEPVPHFHSVALAQHRDGVPPVFTLLHAAVLLKRCRRHHDAVVDAAPRDAILVLFRAHAPKHRAAG
jgi:hypothetical protein